ncbi:uncharacterized protein LOC100378348 [Saccoglossus kowalevskii]|uniref:Uncharacterized protein LOC100378348 n=1 Tax=Saccoglossus kowalevskii TaxID=10224 RepID=A0ABM0N0S5_SACKO|nr:PREDICTED: uncharacterized protein LOC100378348 [Saccoglossus kowalevskii]
MNGDAQFKSFMASTLTGLGMTMEKLDKEQKIIKDRLAAIELKQKDLKRSLQSCEEMAELENNHEHAHKWIVNLEIRVKQLEAQIRASQERALLLRNSYSNGYRLRFSRIHLQPGLNCVNVISDQLRERLGFPNPSDMIESTIRVEPDICHRVASAKNPALIVVKFIGRSDRLVVLRKKKIAVKQESTFAMEEFCQEENKRKRELRQAIEEAYIHGKRPCFTNGKLYINGELYN